MWLKDFESSLLIEEIASSGFNGVVVGDSVVLTVSPPSASGTHGVGVGEQEPNRYQVQFEWFDQPTRIL